MKLRSTRVPATAFCTAPFGLAAVHISTVAWWKVQYVAPVQYHPQNMYRTVLLLQSACCEGTGLP
jgi:hypothetical protein